MVWHKGSWDGKPIRKAELIGEDTAMGSHDRTLCRENRTSGPKQNYMNRVIVDSRAGVLQRGGYRPFGPLQLQRTKKFLVLRAS